MDTKDAIAFEKELAQPHSNIRRLYERWASMAMTKRVQNYMMYRSLPDEACSQVSGLPGIGESAACSLLGFCSGRSFAAKEMVGLAVETENEEVNEDFMMEADDE